MSHKNRTEQGFSLIETLIVLGIIIVLATITVFKSFGTMESYQANSAMDVVASQLRVARQLAISQRRAVQVWFNTLLLTRLTLHGQLPGSGASTCGRRSCRAYSHHAIT